VADGYGWWFRNFGGAAFPIAAPPCPNDDDHIPKPPSFKITIPNNPVRSGRLKRRRFVTEIATITCGSPLKTHQSRELIPICAWNNARTLVLAWRPLAKPYTSVSHQSMVFVTSGCLHFFEDKPPMLQCNTK
jgi:hypothetical protein